MCRFSPQFVAGPIVRFRHVEQDLENIDHANQSGYLERGWSFFVRGMVKKGLDCRLHCMDHQSWCLAIRLRPVLEFLTSRR